MKEMVGVAKDAVLASTRTGSKARMAKEEHTCITLFIRKMEVPISQKTYSQRVGPANVLHTATLASITSRLTLDRRKLPRLRVNFSFALTSSSMHEGVILRKL